MLPWVPHNSVTRPALSPQSGPYTLSPVPSTDCLQHKQGLLASRDHQAIACPQCPAQAQPGPWCMKAGRPPGTPHSNTLTEVAPGRPRSPVRPCHHAGTCTRACPMHTASVSRSCWELTRHLLLTGQQPALGPGCGSQHSSHQSVTQLCGPTQLCSSQQSGRGPSGHPGTRQATVTSVGQKLGSSNHYFLVQPISITSGMAETDPPSHKRRHRSRESQNPRELG